MEKIKVGMKVSELKNQRLDAFISNFDMDGNGIFDEQEAQAYNSLNENRDIFVSGDYSSDILVDTETKKDLHSRNPIGASFGQTVSIFSSNLSAISILAKNQNEFDNIKIGLNPIKSKDKPQDYVLVDKNSGTKLYFNYSQGEGGYMLYAQGSKEEGIPDKAVIELESEIAVKGGNKGIDLVINGGNYQNSTSSVSTGPKGTKNSIEIVNSNPVGAKEILKKDPNAEIFTNEKFDIVTDFDKHALKPSFSVHTLRGNYGSASVIAPNGKSYTAETGFSFTYDRAKEDLQKELKAKLKTAGYADIDLQ